jgi:hypothetical protein
MEDLSQKDGQDLIKAKPAMKSTGKTRKRLSYDPKFIKLVSRLVAAGHDATDIAFLIGVKKGTIEQWKHRYPVFRKAWDDGKKIAGSYLVATGLKLCEGYEISEETIKSSMNKLTEEWEETEKKVVKKHIAPNAALIQFFLTKLCPEVFGTEKADQQPQQTKVLDVAQGIQQLAGKLTQFAGGMQEPVEAEFEETDELNDSE